MDAAARGACAASWSFVFSSGGLIQACGGKTGGCGVPRTNARVTRQPPTLDCGSTKIVRYLNGFKVILSRPGKFEESSPFLVEIFHSSRFV